MVDGSKGQRTQVTVGVRRIKNAEADGSVTDRSSHEASVFVKTTTLPAFVTTTAWQASRSRHALHELQFAKLPRVIVQRLQQANLRKRR